MTHNELCTSVTTGYGPTARATMDRCSSFLNAFYCASLHTRLLKINDAIKLLNNIFK
jgi:hypothetical protein